jgi:general secretion pathway protein J
MTGYLGLGGLYILRLEYLDNRSGGQLMMTRWLYHPDILEGVDAVPEWEALHQTSGGFRDYLERSEGETREVFSQQILLESLDAVEFGYYGTPSDRSSDPEWQDEWDDPQVLPRLVRVSIHDDSGWWPDILADLSSAQDVAAGVSFGGRR